MTDTKLYFITGIFILCLMSCKKPPRNYYADQNNPGLSRLTSYGYNIATNYINGVAYINPYNNPSYFGFVPPPPAGNVIPVFNKIIGTGTTDDTLALAWPVEVNNNAQSNSYFYISILMPVSKGFTVNDFAGLSGERFDSNTNIISLTSYLADSYYNYNYPTYSDSLVYTSPRGFSNIYFVNISMSSSGDLAMSGLFNGNIGDTAITNGRFDFYLPSSYIHF
jgi:hypothetical protein